MRQQEWPRGDGLGRPSAYWLFLFPSRVAATALRQTPGNPRGEGLIEMANLGRGGTLPQLMAHTGWLWRDIAISAQ